MGNESISVGKQLYAHASYSLTTEEVCDILKASTDIVQSLAVSGQLPGAKIGKKWVFIREDVETFLRREVNRQTLERTGSTIPGRLTRASRQVKSL